MLVASIIDVQPPLDALEAPVNVDGSVPQLMVLQITPPHGTDENANDWHPDVDVDAEVGWVHHPPAVGHTSVAERKEVGRRRVAEIVARPLPVVAAVVVVVVVVGMPAPALAAVVAPHPLDWQQHDDHVVLPAQWVWPDVPAHVRAHVHLHDDDDDTACHHHHHHAHAQYRWVIGLFWPCVLCCVH